MLTSMRVPHTDSRLKRKSREKAGVWKGEPHTPDHTCSCFMAATRKYNQAVNMIARLSQPVVPGALRDLGRTDRWRWTIRKGMTR